jgi:hypothetical protein
MNNLLYRRPKTQEILVAGARARVAAAAARNTSSENGDDDDATTTNDDTGTTLTKPSLLGRLFGRSTPTIPSSASSETKIDATALADQSSFRVWKVLQPYIRKPIPAVSSPADQRAPLKADASYYTWGPPIQVTPETGPEKSCIAINCGTRYAMKGTPWCDSCMQFRVTVNISPSLASQSLVMILAAWGCSWVHN